MKPMTQTNILTRTEFGEAVYQAAKAEIESRGKNYATMTPDPETLGCLKNKKPCRACSVAHFLHTFVSLSSHDWNQ